MSNIPVKNPLKNLKMTDALSTMSKYGGLAKSSQFAVSINPPPFMTANIPDGRTKTSTVTPTVLGAFTYLCEAAEMPGRGMMSLDVRYHGPAEKLPFQTQYEDITLTFLCRSESYERQFFDDWMEAINPTNSFNFNWRNEYETTILIRQFAEYEAAKGQNYPKQTYAITLFNAYPVLINPQPVTWADDQIMRLAVTFTYHKWQRVGRDNSPKNRVGL